MEDNTVMLKLLLFLSFPLLSSADTHTLQYLKFAVTPGVKFTAVGLVDGEQFVFYDNNMTRRIPEWMNNTKAVDPNYWTKEEERVKDQKDFFQKYMDGVMKIFNQSEGVHTLQRIYGCECNNNTPRGYDEYGYDGEDFISLDLETGTWTAAKDKAEIFIYEWDPKRTEAKKWKNFLKTDCIDRLQMVLNCGKETLERKVPPTASVFQKHSSSPAVVCHATGFFPKTVHITWQKDGEDVHEDVDLRETLPNQDRSFQKRSILNVSAEDLQKHTYTCVIQHSSLEKEIVLPVSKQPVTEGVHTLQYLYTALTPGINFPEFTAVWLVNGEQFMYYDSNIRKVIPKTEWIQKIESDNPDYRNSETSHMQSQQESFQDAVKAVMQSLNHSTGVHTLQRMYGCALDHDGTTRRYDVFGYDGEDFISLDLKTGTWTAAESPALLFIKKWESAGAEGVDQKTFLENDCIDELKKFVSYGRETLKRKGL